jgi:predicted Zn-dependent protease with MMP-like domain
MNLTWDQLRAIAEEEVERALQSLPKPLRETASRLPVTLEPAPSAGLQADGILPDTLGLFTGAEHAEEGLVTMPPQIMLFLDTLWEFADGDEQVYREEIRTTLLHELGHYLGLNEEELTDRGLD